MKNGPVDILHLTYYPRLLPKRKGAKMVVTVYDLIPERFPELYKDNDLIERRKRVINEADMFLCISESTRKDLIDIYNVDVSRTATIHLGPSFDESLIKKVDTKNIKLATKKPYVLYVGIRDKYKNFINMLEAYATSKSVSQDYDLVCFGSYAFSDDETKRISKLGVERNVHHVVGSDSMLLHYYKAAHAFIYPSLYEGFGFPLLESMQAGCPIAASDRSSIPEVLGNAGILFNPVDQGSMQEAIGKIVFDERLRSICIERGRQRVKEFSWERTAKKTYSSYCSCLGNNEVTDKN
jgi:glycosyltransferase involved in cell wall biosynthesis